MENTKNQYSNWDQRLHSIILALFFFFFLRFCSLIFKEGGKDRGREGEKQWCEKHRSVASCTLPTRDLSSATRACALTGNQTSNLSVCRPALNPLSHTSQGSSFILDVGRFKSMSRLHTKCCLSLDRNLFSIFSWCSWNLKSLGKPWTKKPRLQT